MILEGVYSRDTQTPALTENMIMAIWVGGTSNQLFKTGFYNDTKFSTKKISD